VELYRQLRIEGNRIVDHKGQAVSLRGMSLFWSQWQGQYYNAEVIRWLRDDWGCDIVRAAVAVHHDGYLANPEAEMRKVDTVVRAALDLGMYVIVDWHAHDPEPEAAGDFFAAVASTYGHHPNIIYETWNEPLADHDWSRVIKPYHEAVIARIRQHDPDNLIVCGTQTWSQDVDKAAANPLPAANIAYALHFYAATHQQALRDRAQQALDQGVALMVTEWGTSEASGTGALDSLDTRLWWKFMDQNELSWCNWSISDKDETSAALLPGAAAKGKWPLEMLSASGKLVRNELRRKRGEVSTTLANK
jgi:endoglucanase